MKYLKKKKQKTENNFKKNANKLARKEEKLRCLKLHENVNPER